MTTRLTDLLRQQLSPKQGLSVIEANARVNVWEGAISSGKTVASLLAWLLFVANAPRNGELAVIGKTTTTLSRNVFAPLMNADIFGPYAKYIEHTPGAPSAMMLGRKVHVIGANDVKAESKIRGLTAAGFYVDELTLLPNEAFWDQLIGRMRVPGARLYGTTNPDSRSHWFRKRVLKGGDRFVRSWHYSLYDNPFLPPETIEHYEQTYVGLFRQRMIEGLWTSGEGAIYDMFDPARHVVDVVPQIKRWLAVGCDYGTTNPFSAVLIGIGIDRRLYVVSEYRYDSRQAGRQLTDAEYSEGLRNWLANVKVPGSQMRGVSPEYILIDPSAASFKAQLSRDGLTVASADNEVMDGIRELMSLFANGNLLIHRSCEGLIDELPGYSWDPRSVELGKDAPAKEDDHSVDALRYGTFKTRRLWRDELRAA